jgi:RNA-binding protein
MLTGKQRSSLRAMANELPAIFQVGKGGINDNMIKQLNEALNVRELIKVTVLKNALVEPRIVAEEIAEATGAELIQVIGYKFVLYKESKENKTIALMKDGTVKRIEKAQLADKAKRVSSPAINTFKKNSFNSKKIYVKKNDNTGKLLGKKPFKNSSRHI